MASQEIQEYRKRRHVTKLVAFFLLGAAIFGLGIIFVFGDPAENILGTLFWIAVAYTGLYKLMMLKAS